VYPYPFFSFLLSRSFEVCLLDLLVFISTTQELCLLVDEFNPVIFIIIWIYFFQLQHLLIVPPISWRPSLAQRGSVSSHMVLRQQPKSLNLHIVAGETDLPTQGVSVALVPSLPPALHTEDSQYYVAEPSQLC
jgi:hypothetical protein